jgi:serine/threonine protein kinase
VQVEEKPMQAFAIESDSARHRDSAPIESRHVNGYEILDRIAAGATSVVYRAWDLRLGRVVALKFLDDRFVRDESRRERFLLEAQIAAVLDHPRLCRVHGIESTDDDRLFIVMAYYEGRTLKERLKDGPLTVGDVLVLGAQIADGLAYLHQRSIVHNDVKLANIVVAEDGVRIVDFGLAGSPFGDVHPGGRPVEGTTAYMSPERLRGEPTDSRSDIWSFGVALFEMLTGQTPFTGTYPEAVWYAIRHQPPPTLRTTVPPVPSGVEAFVKRCLEKEPARRFQHAGEAAVELRALAAQHANSSGIVAVGKPAALGRTVSHYRVIGKLGQGGMGVVYEAADTTLPRKVALKFVSDDFAGDPETLRRLKREAETIALLNHPNICSVHEVSEQEGRPFIVMERLDGISLKRLIARRTLRTSEIVNIAMQVTNALEAAHDAGIVHRDIKPENIFVTPTGLVKVLDFGLARRIAWDESGETPLDGSTIVGRPVGTANYMAPERILQLPLDPRSDLFSLGVVIFEMATERLPFAGGTRGETVLNVLDRAPAKLRKLSPRRPASLEAVVGRLLAKEAGRRYQSAAALRHALAGVVQAKRPGSKTAVMSDIAGGKPWLKVKRYVN